ncbi:hypothetical protein SKTS_19240 [Sulfurimicrobium lacus]|uniref:HTH cro/C1-type domain-containing protein n=1 Tax=Sulfurimicrobium lacus TaxID=2715678 RepID=A0A6F8VBE6_9PROT|nr:helix-turn-helix transcriptional regulator [Sulfurimicrobium lacus]BCB27038.1 hypothetical protein SKTS_19240 [Sulfurimicrobium lacus]
MYTPLKQARIRRGQTLADVAQAVETDDSTISRIENRKQSASPELAEKLARHFGNAVTEIEIIYPERFMQSEKA